MQRMSFREQAFQPSKNIVKAPPVQKIQQHKPHQHLPHKRKVRISYVPIAKLDLVSKKKAPANRGLRSLTIDLPGESPQLLYLEEFSHKSFVWTILQTLTPCKGTNIADSSGGQTGHFSRFSTDRGQR
jgi:hypothetical protein